MEEVVKFFYLRIATRSVFFGQTQNYLLDNFQANFQTREISAYFLRTTKKRTSWR